MFELRYVSAGCPARRAAAELDGRRFSDFDEICLFALDFLPERHDVMEYFRRPWRYGATCCPMTPVACRGRLP